MKYLLLFLLFVFNLQLFGQPKIPLRLNQWNFIYSADTNILIKEFQNGLSPFMFKNKNSYGYKPFRVGFTDSAGNVLIPPFYRNTSHFEDGLALVQDSSYQLGVIKLSGRYLIPMAYDSVFRCDNGLLLVKKNGKLGLFNSAGVRLISPNRYTSFATPPRVYRDFNDTPFFEFRWNTLRFDQTISFKNFLAVEENGLWGVISKKGREMVPLRFEKIGIFTDELAVAVTDQKSGVIDNNGKWLVPPIYDKAIITPNRNIVVTSGDSSRVLSPKNKVLIPIRYGEITEISAENFLIHDKKTNRRGIINITGEVIIPTENHNVWSFGSGFIVQRHEPFPHSALYNGNGEQISKYVSNGIMIRPDVWQYNDKNSSKYIVYNSRKDEFVPYILLTDDLNHNNQPRRIAYQKNNRWGILGTNGTEATPAVYEEIRFVRLTYGSQFILAKRKGKWGIVNDRGKVLIDFDFDSFGASFPDVLWLQKGALKYKANLNKPFISPYYD